jgi:hypothetical protein
VHIPHHVTVAHRLAFVPPSHLHALRYINGLQISIPQCNTPVSFFNIKARITQDLYVRGKNIVSVVAYDASSACADASSWAFMAVHTLTEARLLWVTMRENSRLFFAHWRQLSLQYLQVFSRAPDTLSHVTPAPTFVMVTEWLPLLDATADQSQSHHMWAMAASAGIRTVVIARDCEGSFRSFPGGIQNRSAVSSLMNYLNSQPSVQVVCDSDRSSVHLPPLTTTPLVCIQRLSCAGTASAAGQSCGSNIECEQAVELAAQRKHQRSVGHRAAVCQSLRPPHVLHNRSGEHVLGQQHLPH